MKGDLILMHTHSCQLVTLSLRRAMRLLLAALCCMVFVTLTQAQAQAYDFLVPGVSGPNWVDTGLDIPANTLLQLSAIGLVDVSAGWGAHGPEGTDHCAPVTGYPVMPNPYCYGLAARLSPGTEMWSYRNMQQHFTTQGGRLWLTVNDDNPGDNSGFFKVHVELLHVEMVTFPPPELRCHPCPWEFSLKLLLGEYPDPKANQALVVLDGEITAINQSSGTTLVSVSQGSVLAKYGDLPNLKVVFEKDMARPATSLSKQSVIQGVFFQNKKMSLITGASRLELYSKVTGKMGEGMSQLPAGIKSSIDVVSKTGILGTPVVLSGEPLIVQVNNRGSVQKEALVLQIDGKDVAKVDTSQKVFEYVGKRTQWPVGRHVVALVAQGPKGPQTVWVTSFLVLH
jgi:hypothetical protein